ncbi:hypothetical protein, partial [Embleya sp. NPDC056538]|uniref:hypothetical protein n=1 Tax=Embleya sp. NPDC056538 TaxID=3345858 RepID=UPI00367A95C7
MSETVSLAGRRSASVPGEAAAGSAERAVGATSPAPPPAVPGLSLIKKSEPTRTTSISFYGLWCV